LPARLSVYGRGRRTHSGAAARFAAEAGAPRECGNSGEADGNLPARVAGRLAAYRPDRCKDVRAGKRSAGSSAARGPREISIVMSLLIKRPGILTTVQDLGREGHRGLGINPSGAMDRTALRILNTL